MKEFTRLVITEELNLLKEQIVQTGLEMKCYYLKMIEMEVDI